MKKALVVLFAVFVAVSLTLMAARLPGLPDRPAVALRSGGEEPGVAVLPPDESTLVDRTSAGLATPAQLANGAKVYRTLCVSCHLPDGKGMPTVIPPLAGSDFLFADRPRAIRGVLQGMNGPITVNHVGYNAVMPPLEAVLSDRQVADVLTYVCNSWGNQGEAFDAGYVGLIRAGAVPP